MSSPEEDARTINRLLHTSDPRDTEIVLLITSRPRAHRIKIKESFKSLYEEDIVESITNLFRKDYSSNLSSGLEILFEEQSVLDVKDIYNSLKNPNVNEQKIIEILCTRTTEEIRKIKDNYYYKYLKNLDEEICNCLPDEIAIIFNKFINLKRSATKVPDKKTCLEKAKKIFDIPNGCWGDSDSAFLNILATASSRELILISRYYNRQAGKTLLTAIDEQFGGAFCRNLKNMLFILCCPGEYIAKRINDSLVNYVEEKCDIFGILVSRENIDLPLIKRYYNEIFGKDLSKDLIDLYKKEDRKYVIEYMNNH